MLSWLNLHKIIYIFSNIIVLPAVFIPLIDLISNISFVIAFTLLVHTNLLLALALCVAFIVKNNSNYRFNLLLKCKGEEISKSDYECVYVYAWCTLLRYLLIGSAVSQILFFLNNF